MAVQETKICSSYPLILSFLRRTVEAGARGMESQGFAFFWNRELNLGLVFARQVLCLRCQNARCQRHFVNLVCL